MPSATDGHVQGPSDVEMAWPSKVATPPAMASFSATGGQNFFFLTWFAYEARR